ncbi:MAG: M23 family metallopeptidase [Leptospiraceae bacterium]|nr:M23 family metallopeptidase [Leptospiraceae bacterium]
MRLFLLLFLIQTISIFSDRIIENDIPQDSYREITYKDLDYKIIIRAKEFRQGNLAFIKLKSNHDDKNLNPEKFKLIWAKKELILSPYKKVFFAPMPIHPEQKVGENELVIQQEKEDKLIIRRLVINILKGNFPEKKMYSLTKVPKKYTAHKYSQETLEFISKCEKKKQEAFASNSPLGITGRFVRPLEKILITSPFYIRRIYGQNRKSKPHGGVDLRAPTGEKIYAIQDGKVLIAERMFFEGIFTVIDHGGKIFSLYMHQSKTLVKEGDQVKKGDLIGESGSTGVSTGPHLHLGMKVDGTVVNPLSVLGKHLF